MSRVEALLWHSQVPEDTGGALAMLGKKKEMTGFTVHSETQQDGFIITRLILSTCISNIGQGMVKQLSFVWLDYNRYFPSCIV